MRRGPTVGRSDPRYLTVRTLVVSWSTDDQSARSAVVDWPTAPRSIRMARTPARSTDRR